MVPPQCLHPASGRRHPVPGLQRFEQVQVLLGQELHSFTQDDAGVTATLRSSEGVERTLRAKYLVASDGGNSLVRRTLNVPFEGRTKPNQWIVVDVRNDPLGTPHIDMHCDPERPYVSAALPHGIRRFEFMVMPGETEEQLSKPENLAQLMRKVVADPDKVDYIRKRVYTHNARWRRSFGSGDLAGRRCRAHHAGLAGPGLQQRHARCQQSRLEAGHGHQGRGQQQPAG
jgi:3-(3-hydroxy-phenyl)propionate hydroxylase